MIVLSEYTETLRRTDALDGAGAVHIDRIVREVIARKQADRPRSDWLLLRGSRRCWTAATPTGTTPSTSMSRTWWA